MFAFGIKQKGIGSFRSFHLIIRILFVQFQILIGISGPIQEFPEVREGDHKGCGINTGMKTNALRSLKIFIEKEMDVVFRIVDQSERRHGAGSQPEIFHQSLVGSEGQFPLIEAVFQIVNLQVVCMFQHDQVVAVAFMIAEEDVFAVSGFDVGPVFPGLFNGRSRRMLIVGERDIQFFKYPV